MEQAVKEALLAGPFNLTLSAQSELNIRNCPPLVSYEFGTRELALYTGQRVLEGEKLHDAYVVR